MSKRVEKQIRDHLVDQVIAAWLQADQDRQKPSDINKAVRQALTGVKNEDEAINRKSA